MRNINAKTIAIIATVIVAVLAVIWFFNQRSIDNANSSSEPTQLSTNVAETAIPQASTAAPITESAEPTPSETPMALESGEALDQTIGVPEEDMNKPTYWDVNNFQPWFVRVEQFAIAYGDQTVEKEEWLNSMDPYMTDGLQEKLGWARLDGTTHLTLDKVEVKQVLNSQSAVAQVTFKETDTVYLMGVTNTSGQWLVDSVGRDM